MIREEVPDPVAVEWHEAVAATTGGVEPLLPDEPPDDDPGDPGDPGETAEESVVAGMVVAPDASSLALAPPPQATIAEAYSTAQQTARDRRISGSRTVALKAQRTIA